MTLLSQTNDWADVIFTASAMDEPFEDVTIKSARDEFTEIALKAAADLMHGEKLTLENLTHIGFVAATLVNQGKISIQESVTVTSTGITVVVDVPSVEDDMAAYRAMTLVAEALDQLDGNHATVYFGQPFKFSLYQVPGILTRSLS